MHRRYVVGQNLRETDHLGDSKGYCPAAPAAALDLCNEKAVTCVYV